MFFISVFVPMATAALILYAFWHRKPGFQKEYDDNEQGLADLLRYNKTVADGVILGKGGELMATFAFRGIDLDSSTNEEIMAIMGRLNAALKRFGSGWMMQTDGTRTHAVGYPTGGSFPHPVLELMDEERRMQFERVGRHFDSQFTVTITWLPPLKLESAAASMLFEHSEERRFSAEDLERKTIETFENKVAEFQAVAAGMFKSVIRLKSVGAPLAEKHGGRYVVDDQLGFYHYCVTGIGQPIRRPLHSVLELDAVLGSQSFTGGITPRVGENHIRVVGIEGFPTEAAPLVMSALNRLPVQYRWSSRFIFLDREEAISKFAMVRRKWRQKMRPVMDDLLGKTGGPIDQDAVEMSMDAEAAMSEASSGLVGHGCYTSVVVLMDREEEVVEENAKVVAKLIADIGFPTRVEKENTVEAYLGSLPGHGRENVRRPAANTMNFAYLFPSVATWSGVAKHPCAFYPPGSPPLFVAEAPGGTPFRGVLHYGDLGMFFVVGPAGSGKSTAIQFFLAQHYRYPKARAFVFEKGYSGFVMADGTGGTHYDVGGENDTNKFAPFAAVHKPNERQWAEDWLVMCLELQGHKASAKDRTVLREALKKLGSSPVETRTFTELVSLIQDTHLREALNFYTVAGANHYLDGKPEEERISFGRLNVFEMEHLMEMGEQHLLPILWYLFRRIETSLKGEPTLILLDEVWLMMLLPLFRDKIKAWVKTLRKANVGIGFATQELGDLANSPIRDVIFTNCLTRFLLPNPYARAEAQKKIYLELGLNDQQIDLIAMGTPKQDYYYTSPYGSRMFRLALGPMCLAFTGASGKEEVALARSLRQQYGDRWIVEWTRRRAGEEWAARLERKLAVAA